jgi:hypothetical protein
MSFNFTGLSDKEAAFIISALAEFPIKTCGGLHAKLVEQHATQLAASAVSKSDPAPAAPSE